MDNEKKHKSGFALPKEKQAKAESQIQTLESQLSSKKEELRRTKYELQTTIEQQSRKIQGYEEDLTNAQSAAREYRRQAEEAIRRMGWLRRLWYGYNIPKFSDDDQWND